MTTQTTVITVTLNASLDRTIVTHFLGHGYENRAIGPTRLDAAGTGLAISRALHQLDCPTRAIVIVGDDPTALAYQALLDEEDFPVTAISVPGNTRSNTVILDTGLKTETQISDEGAPLSPENLTRLEEAVRKFVRPDDLIVIAGPAPVGEAASLYRRLTDFARDHHARSVIFSQGEALADVLPARPDLVTLTQVETEGYFNFPVRDLKTVLWCGRKLLSEGPGRVLIEMREAGAAALISADEAFMINIPETAALGTSSGVWEALLAGYLAGRVDQKPVDESLELGAAAAAYTSAQIGHEFGTLDEVETMAEEMALKPPDEMTGEEPDTA